MNKAEQIREKLGFNKREAGIYILGHRTPHYASVAWGRVDRAESFHGGMALYLDLLGRIVESEANGEAWAKELLATWLVLPKGDSHED